MLYNTDNIRDGHLILSVSLQYHNLGLQLRFTISVHNLLIYNFRDLAVSSGRLFRFFIL